jgi:preprotein translocase SecE subunit
MAAVTKKSNDGKDAMADEEDSVEPETALASTKGSAAPKTPVVSYGHGSTGGGKGFFTIRKKGQGYWTRMGTAIGAAFIGLMVTLELYNQIPTFLHGSQQGDRNVAIALSAIFLIAYAAIVFWYTNKPTTVDFLIATDSEMKKVNWTTRAELIGSTKIVVLFMFLIAIYLFVCDLLFGGFFHMVGVLKTIF